jgi:hypothetical protein
MGFDQTKVTADLTKLETGFQDERKKLREAIENLSKKKATALLAVTFNEPTLLQTDQAREMLANAKSKGVKLIKEEKEAIADLDIAEWQIAYDLAKFDCDTSDKAFRQLETQLSFIQSEMKLR